MEESAAREEHNLESTACAGTTLNEVQEWKRAVRRRPDADSCGFDSFLDDVVGAEQHVDASDPLLITPLKPRGPEAATPETVAKGSREANHHSPDTEAVIEYLKGKMGHGFADQLAL